MPPFAKNKQQFSKHDSDETREIAAARVHVERTIQRVKMFKIMKNKLPWSLIPYIDNICVVVSATVNLKNPLLAYNKF